ncbi:MAG: uracil-DNA glycosylase [Gammaproteobacteria bacterium]
MNAPRAVPLDVRRRALLAAMDIDVWVPRTGPAAIAPARADDVARARAVVPAGDDARAAALATLAREVAACEACELARTRTQTVFGVGAANARCLVIGEAPGAEEDRRGEPFVGRAGQLLNSMLAAIGLARESVYIANILKCRPPANRDPQAAEVLACRGFLTRQVALIAPRVIVAVGRVAAQNLLGVDTPIGRMRGHDYAYGDTAIPVVVTYHPAYLLRSPGEKRKAWQDLQRARRILAAAEDA